jgi:hypothetical protein
MSNIGQMIDALYETREERLELERTANMLKKVETQLSDDIIKGLSDVDLKAGRGDRANFSFKKEEVPNVTNWPVLFKFVATTNEFGLLQKRISIPVWKSFKEENELIIPGTEVFELTKVSLTKAGK